MTHLHKLPTYRHPVTRERAVMVPAPGDPRVVQVLYFAPRKRYAHTEEVYANRVEARSWLGLFGFEVTP